MGLTKIFSFSISGKTDYSVEVPNERFEIIANMADLDLVDSPLIFSNIKVMIILTNLFLATTIILKEKRPNQSLSGKIYILKMCVS